MSVTLRVKICGITRLEDALLSVELGAWAVGFVFYQKSSRAVAPSIVKVMTESLPAHVHKVGVFVDSTLEQISQVVQTSGIDHVQLHGTESPEFCAALKSRLPDIGLIKALRVKGPEQLELARGYGACDAILLDAFVDGLPGGTGKTFDWSLASQVRDLATPLIVSGGLSRDNVLEAARVFQPYAVDVSSGVELRPGIKNGKALEAFFAQTRSANKEAV